MRFNPSISVYWLWLVIIAGILAVIPVVPYQEMGFTAHLHIAYLFAACLYDYHYYEGVSSYTALGDDKWILLYGMVSTVLAVVATVLHHAWAKRHQAEYRPDSPTYTLATLWPTTVAIACLFSLLAFLGSIYAIYVVVLLFAAGRLATLLLAGFGL